MVNVTLAIQYYKESNKHTQKLINVKRIESKASTFHKVPASKEGVHHNGCGQVNKEWHRSRILPGVGYLLQSDITHDPSHGLPSDTLTVEILLELPEIWTLLHRAVGSHFVYTEQSAAVY